MNTKKILILVGGIIVVLVGYILLVQEKKVPPVADEAIVYDVSLPAEYVSTPERVWPPETTFLTGDFSCEEGGGQMLTFGETREKEIEGVVYCVSIASEGAAGSTYTTYVYTTTHGEYIARTTFTLRFVQCENYDEPKKTECKDTQGNFDPYLLGHHISMNAKANFNYK